MNVDPEQLAEQMDAFGIDFPPGRVPVLDPQRNDIGLVTDVRAVAKDKLEVTMEIEDADVLAALGADTVRGVST